MMRKMQQIKLKLQQIKLKKKQIKPQKLHKIIIQKKIQTLQRKHKMQQMQQIKQRKIPNPKLKNLQKKSPLNRQ